MKLRSCQSVRLVAAFGIGCALGLFYSGSNPAADLIPSAKAEEQVTRGELDRLLKTRYDTANALLDLEEKRLREGVTTLGRVCEAARWVRDSAVELPVSAQERLAAL